MFASVSTLIGLEGSRHVAAAAEPAWPSHVAATYKIAFNGFDIGRFAFEASVRSGRYTLNGNAEISALLGFVKWQGLTRTSGRVAGNKATPEAYSFDYQSSAKSGNVRFGFREGNVTAITMDPPLEKMEDVVPLERGHLNGVLDPLTAVMAMTRPASDNPCQQKLSIFDGQQRFDLATTPVGSRQIVERQPSGQPGVAHVCEMRYRPISGYKRGKETDDMVRTLKIEVALRPVPDANLFVPHEIKIPTLVGSAVLKLDKIDILTSNQDQIAFAN